jgi:hypothetical protein
MKYCTNKGDEHRARPIGRWKRDLHLESVEEQGHGLTHGPSDEDQQRKDSESDLDSRPDGDTEGQVELVLDGDRDGTDVLGH